MNINFISQWGPFSKKYMGLSKILNETDTNKDDKQIFSNEFGGSRFDFTVIPSIFGFEINIPNTTVPCGVHPWQCTNDYSLFAYRFDILEKDKVYGEVTYYKADKNTYIVETNFVNNSTHIQNCLVNMLSSVEFPHPEYTSLFIDDDSIFIDALNYDEYTYKISRPWDEQNPDAMMKGEFVDENFVLGHGLGDRAPKWHLPQRRLEPFGMTKGDKVRYTFDLPCDKENAVCFIRYKTVDIIYEENKMNGVDLTDGLKDSVFTLNGKEEIVFESTNELKIKKINLGKIKKGENTLEFTALGSEGIELDFLIIGNDETTIKIEKKIHDYVPTKKITQKNDGFTLELNYKNNEQFFVGTFDKSTRFRDIDTGCLEDCLPSRLSNNDATFDDVTDPFTASFSRKHSDEGFFEDALVHTIFVEPGKSKKVYCIISSDKDEFQRQFDIFDADTWGKQIDEKRREVCNFNLNEQGKKYELSNNIMRATLLMNVVYPLYGCGRNVVHHTPGKRWDCFYTWDSGFIGLGMNEFNPDAAKYILKLYLTDNDKYGSFVFHGSPVPVQFVLYIEQLKKTNDKSELLSLYEKMRKYYEFYSGKEKKSTTDKFKTGLLSTYDYFYSSSGMDDYPAQVAMMNKCIREQTAPCITSSQCIIAAKVMYMVSSLLNKTDDMREYSNDIDRLSNALDRYAWDEKSGYYSYVVHDENGEFSYRLTTEGLNDIDCQQVGDRRENAYPKKLSLDNVNRGLDGIYPFIAGVTSRKKNEIILSHLKNEKEMNSPYGISAVDMSAEYFTVNGYWNGNVWLSHQWFIYKSLLDIGETDLAFEIARKSLEIWAREVGQRYYTYEMFSVVTGCGGWFHNFGGLSAPINIFADAYYCPGTVTSGINVFIDETNFNDDKTSATIKYRTFFKKDEEYTLIVTLSDKVKRYKVKVNGKEKNCFSRLDGEIEITMPYTDEKEEMTIEILPM